MVKRGKNIRVGRITPNGVSVEKHENDTILIFTELGYDIEYIRPINVPRIKNPDIVMDGKIWEMKCPDGKSYKTLENKFKLAVAKTPNIIIDLRRSKLNKEKCVEDLIKYFNKSKRVKNMIVVKSRGEILTFKK